MLFHHRQRLDAGGGLQHGIAALRQGARTEGAHGLLVLDQQHRAVAGMVGGGLGLAVRLGRSRSRLLHLLAEMARQIDAEHGAASHRAVAEDEPARLLDEAIHHRQAEPGALADLLGGEEGLEDLVDDLLRDTCAGILDLDQHIVRHRHLALAGGLDLAGRHVARADRQLATVRHGVTGVHRQVDDDLLELGQVGAHRPQVPPVPHVELDPLPEQPLQQHAELGQDLAEMHHLRPQGLPPRERQQLPHEPGGPVGVLLDLHDVLERRIRRPVVHQQQVRIAEDALQHVVEVMRHAAGQLADGLHLLRLGELRLQRPLLGGLERIDRRHLAVLGLGLHTRDEEPGRAVALPRKPEVERRDVVAACRCRGDGRRQRLALALPDDGQDRARLAGLVAAERRPEQPGERAIGAGDPPVPVDRGDRQRRVVEEAGEPHLGGALALRHVLAGRAVEHQRPRRSRRAVIREGDAVEEPHRQALAAALAQVEVMDLGPDLAGAADHTGQQRRAVARHEVGQGQAARAELGEVIVEPARQRGVHVDNLARRIDRHEAGRGMVEIVDGVLQLLEDVLLALAVARHVGDAPQHRPADAGPLQRPHLHPVPGHAVRRAERRRQADLLRRHLALAGRLGEPVDRLRHLRRPGEQAFDGEQAVPARRRAGQAPVGLVGVGDAAVTLDNEEAVRGGVGHRPGQVAPRCLAAELDDPDGRGEQGEYAHHREQGEKADDQRLCLFAGQQRQRNRGSDQPARQRQQQQDIAAAWAAPRRGRVLRRRGVLLGALGHVPSVRRRHASLLRKRITYPMTSATAL